MATHTTPETPAGGRKGWTKARAILAGGIVLGVGAAVTLAAWTDQEFATGSFSTGSFGIVGQADSAGGFTEHATTPEAATLSFTGSDEMTPGDAVYSLFEVRLKSDSTRQAAVTATETKSTTPQAPDLSEHLTASAVVLDPAATCDAAAFAGAPTAFQLNSGSFNLPSLASVQRMCIRVQLDNDQTVEQGSDGVMSWSFQATSGDAVS